MNHHQHFSATPCDQSRDRMSMFDFGYWDKTIDTWHTQGLPAVVNKVNIPFGDHLVSPGLSLSNFLYCLKKTREIWCKGVNLNSIDIVEGHE